MKVKPLFSIDAHRLIGGAGDVAGELLRPSRRWRASTPPLLSDSTVVISRRGGLTVAAISAALPVKVRATSSLTPVSLRSASPAPSADGVAGGDRQRGRASARLRRVDFDDLAQLFHARIERVGGGLAAGLDLRGDRLGAADQQLLEAADAAVERGRRLRCARRAERAVDLAGLGADGRRPRRCRAVDR